MKILIVDDQVGNRLLLKKMLSKKYTLVFAENGVQAVESAESEKPDLILMDIMMPVMNGIEATREIRAIHTEKWIPIIILSALSDEKQVLEGLSVGADDYLTKPLNQSVLQAKIRTMQYSIEMQRKILVLNEQLTAYQQKNEIEQDFAKDIFDHLIKSDRLKDEGLQDEGLQYWLSPSKQFSGDLIAVKRVNEDSIYFLVADSMGHGLAASIPTIIVNLVFQSMVKKSLSVSVIVKEINMKLRGNMPNGRFVALAVGKIDNKNKSMHIWNGGLPEIMIVNKQGKIIHSFKSKHVFSGVLADDEFDENIETWVWPEECEMFSYTDGVTDAIGIDKDIFGEQRLKSILATEMSIDRVTVVKKNVMEFIDQGQEQDDVSCLSIKCHE